MTWRATSPSGAPKPMRMHRAWRAAGLAVVLSGTTGFSNFTVDNGVARLYLTGTCNSNGSTYTIANLVYANLAQFPEIQWIADVDPLDML